MNNDLLDALLSRRSLKPKYLTAPAPSEDNLKLAARAALRAPVHGSYCPCRFVLIPDEKRHMLAELFRAATAKQGADVEKQERAASKALKGPQILAFVVCRPADANFTESLISAGAALEQFLLALRAQGFGAITLSGSVLKDEALQAAFCKTPEEKLVAWITTGTPSQDATSDLETRDSPFELWS